MFIFRLLNIIVGQKISYNDKARSSAQKGLVEKSACFVKRLCFISKKLRLIQRITVNGVVPCTSETSGTNSSLLLKKKTHKKKKKRKEKARSSVGRSFEKSHNTNTKFHFRDVTITSRDYKIFLYILENYN